MVPGRGPDLRGDGVALSPKGRGTFVLFNPASGRGRGARRRGHYLELLARFLPGFDHALTRTPGEEYRLADEALAAGYTTLIAVGGDGTWSHVADRVLASGRTDVRLGLLPAGTGNDFARSLGLRFSDPEAAVQVLARGHTRRLDAGRIRTPTHPGVPGDLSAPTAAAEPRHFLNVVGIGFDIAVVDAAAHARFLRGEALYKFTAVQQLLRYPGIEVEIECCDGRRERRHCLMVTISNSPFFGGGFRIAPRATVEDGLLHACMIGDAPPLRRMRLFAAAGKGGHTDADEVQMIDAPRFTARSSGPIRFEADGDIFTAPAGELEVEIIPGALEVLAEA